MKRTTGALRGWCALAVLCALTVSACSLNRPVPSPGASATAQLQPVGFPVLSDSAAAAHVRRSSWEPRPQNRVPNSTMPTAAQLSSYRRLYAPTGGNARFRELKIRVTGHFTGTTDEIIQWAAWKWGLPEDMIRAVAFNESHWRMQTQGDDGRSFGLMQVQASSHPGTWPMSQASTAFNVDHFGFVIRAYYEDVHPWLTTAHAGDLWGAVGAWFSGAWHDAQAQPYITRQQDTVAARPWNQPTF